MSGESGLTSWFISRISQETESFYFLMAHDIRDETEQRSNLKPERNDGSETAERESEEQAVSDPKQEPGDEIVGMNVRGATGSFTEHCLDSLPVPGSDKEAGILMRNQHIDEAGDELSEAGKSPVQGSLASSVDSTQEGSRVLKQEQRKGENVPSPSPSAGCTKTAERATHGTKRRASQEVTSSDGEPLSRMDSEDRSVRAVIRPTTVSARARRCFQV